MATQFSARYILAMFAEEAALLVATSILVLALCRKRQKRKRRSEWVAPVPAKRLKQGAYHNLIQEMRLGDAKWHIGYLRMTAERFDDLLKRVGPRLVHPLAYRTARDDRPEITAGERLAVTLRYLATGNSQADLAYTFRMGRATICKILDETLAAIWECLQPEFLSTPREADEWKIVSRDFENSWNFPHCLGAIDGKHILIQAPANAGSTYFNYKGTHSVVLMAVVDANYRFLYVDIGDYGRQCDAGVFSTCSFGRALESGVLNLPEPDELRNERRLPYVFVGDEAFPLKINLLRPFPGRNVPIQQRIFNYRLSRARRVVENAFGILAARWRIFRRPIIASPQKVTLITQAACVLHNYMRSVAPGNYCPPGYLDSEDGAGDVVPGEWRNDLHRMPELRFLGSNHHSMDAREVRNEFMEYCNSPIGAVSWQQAMVTRTQ